MTGAVAAVDDADEHPSDADSTDRAAETGGDDAHDRLSETDPDPTQAGPQVETLETASSRWTVGLVVALFAVGVGIAAGNTAIFLSSVVGLSYAAYGYAIRPPEPTLAVDRRLSTQSPAPGDTVVVVLTVTNEGDDPLAEVSVADEPPASLAVESGETTTAAALQPGESTTLEYTLRVRRGTYTFGDVTLLARNLNASSAVTTRLSLETTLECTDYLERLPLAGQTNQHTGRVETDIGGEGLEFYSIRSYHPTDPMNRVDWNRLARTGELTTVEFREERAASVVVVVDCRESTTVAPEETALDGRTLSKHAAAWVVSSLLGENNRVGVACYGGSGHYLLPRSGRDQATRARRLLDGEWCGSYGRSGWLRRAHVHVGRFCTNLADEKQIVFVTPALDGAPIDSAKRFRAYGHEVTVLCPIVADGDTPGGTVARLEHEPRLRELREHGVRVVEWPPDDPLHVAVDRANRMWSR
ncbi:DUF58 domain-containing protein [Natronobiforma cellulositropha]|uniref:DUF58 domain-containing protein n=1 Tax=Natronobiforma cellulositropha TaxID=1679076 RepID=UPI0021D5C059|nr:DUF58 domain-containing protein [Natronobiforma cellulositropha]